MEKKLTAIDMTDNGGRRLIRDRRFLVSAPGDEERRTSWERRSGYDRRLRRLPGHPIDHRFAEKRQSDSP